MTHRFTWLSSSAVAFAVAAPAAFADGQCIEFAWDARAEHALYAMQPELLSAGADRATAPAVSVDRLYQLRLKPQTAVQFPTGPGSREAAAGAYAGLAHLKVAVAGAYRISADQPLWIDVAFNGALLKPQDFEARKGCNAPHKIIEFVLPMGVQLTLQFSNAANPDAKIAITPAPDAAH
jgi:hypothetical protein